MIYFSIILWENTYNFLFHVVLHADDQNGRDPGALYPAPSRKTRGTVVCDVEIDCLKTSGICDGEPIVGPL